ncbi:MAG TPA: hypothetical protein VKV18_01220 [Chthonomonas sp.]|nr:hypothetical protein [Chthonomonas sp.]
MKQKVRRIVSELYRKVYAKWEEFAFGFSARQPLPKPKLTRRTAARALLGTGWFLMGLQAIQEWAGAASMSCVPVIGSCPNGCMSSLVRSFFCCASLVNSSGKSVACCQFSCDLYACLGSGCQGGSYVNETLVATYTNRKCSNTGFCL